jgi:phospholipase/carboxylesterase
MQLSFDNRSADTAATALTDWCDLDAGGVVEVASRTGLCRAFLPCHYEPAYRYPLIVWLRSSMRDDADIAHWMPTISDRNYVAIEMTGPLAARFALGRSSWPSDRSALPAVEAAVETGIVTASDHFSIHPDRVFVAGVGETAALAMTASLISSQQLAGAMAIDSGPACLMTLLREFRRMRDRRLFLGSAHQCPAPRGTLELVDLLTTAGVHVETCDTFGTERARDTVGRRMNEWVMEICGQRR